MIKLVFTAGRETISIEINNKVITYKDRRFSEGFLFMPIDSELKKKLLMPRINRIPREIVDLINDANSGKNLKEYEEAQDDETLAAIVKKDAVLKGCVFHTRMDS